MSTATDIDVAALVGEMDAVPCEFPQHGHHPIHTDEPASHYARSKCPTCGRDTGVLAACPGFIAATRANLYGICRICKSGHNALEVITILGPVNQ